MSRARASIDRSAWARLFDRQREVALRLFEGAGIRKEDRLGRALVALCAEVGELVQANSTVWKWWRREEARDRSGQAEVVDVLLLLSVVAIEMGCDADELLNEAGDKIGAFERQVQRELQVPVRASIGPSSRRRASRSGAETKGGSVRRRSQK